MIVLPWVVVGMVLSVFMMGCAWGQRCARKDYEPLIERQNAMIALLIEESRKK